MVLQAEGTAAVLAYIEEGDGWGVTPASSATWTGLDLVSESLGLDINLFESNTIRSDRMTGAILRGNRNPAGDFSFELSPSSHNLLLRHLLGGVWASSGGGDPYTHEIEGSSTLPVGGMTIAKGFTDVPTYLSFPGGRVNSVSFQVPQEGFIQCSASILAKTEVTPSATAPWDVAPDYSAADPYEANLTQISVQEYASDGDYTWTPSEILGVATAGQFSIANNLDASSFVLNSAVRYSLPAGRRRIEGSMNLIFADTVEYLRYVNGTSLAMRIKMISKSYSHTWDFPNIRYAGAKPTPAIAGEGGLRQDIPFRAIRHADLGYDVKLTVLNEQTGVTLY